MRVGLRIHQELAEKLMEENKTIILLIEDEEMLEEIESKLRRNELMEDFTNDFLRDVRAIMTHPTVLKLFYSGKQERLNSMLLKMVG